MCIPGMDGMYGMDGMDVMDSMTNILDPYLGSNPSPLDGDWICAIPRRFKELILTGL